MNEAVLVIDKVAGPSSFDVVRTVRQYIGIKKVGHAGSLDPFATGVLVLLTGRATKLSNALLNADKRYEALLKLGEATDSMDRTGNVIESGGVPPLTQEEVEKVLMSFKGEWKQVPPMFSAKKIQGVRLYELARKNLSVDREPIAVQLYDIKLLEYNSPFIRFSVHCSKGTYIRTLADEVARRLGTVGHLSELRRTQCGNFSLEESITVENLMKSASAWKEMGHQAYLKLLSAEGVVRAFARPQVDGNRRLGNEDRFGHRGVSPYLPRLNNSGNSILN